MSKVRSYTVCRNAIKSATVRMGLVGGVLIFPLRTSANVVRDAAVWMKQQLAEETRQLKSHGKELIIQKFRDIETREFCIEMRLASMNLGAPSPKLVPTDGPFATNTKASREVEALLKNLTLPRRDPRTGGDPAREQAYRLRKLAEQSRVQG